VNKKLIPGYRLVAGEATADNVESGAGGGAAAGDHGLQRPALGLLAGGQYPPDVGLLIGDLLADAAAVRPRGLAATLAGEELTYSELDASANRWANALAGLGVGPGDRVAFWLVPSFGVLAGFGGCARLGAVFVPLSTSLGPEELAAPVAYLAPRLLVVDPSRADAAAEVCSGLGVPLAVSGAGAPLSASVTGMDRRLKDASALPPGVPVDDGDAHIVYLTSGTTGGPKGVTVSHRASWLRSFPGGSAFAGGLRGDGGILTSFPLTHYGGWHYVLEAWHHRCPIHLCERFDGGSLADTAARRRPTAVYCIPAVWSRVLEAAPIDRSALASVRHADTGTSAAPPELLERLRARMPEATTSVLYGSTEGGHHTTLHHWETHRKPGSVGRAAPPGVIAVAGDGEILYRSPTVMTGYLDRPDETAAALAGGWYHTGDLGSLDEDGYLHITGRLREVIRTGGETVAPAEVDAAISGYPGLLDVAVVGLPDDTWGEIVCAAVVPAPGLAAPSVEELRAHVRARLASFKHPRKIVVVDAVPRTDATGQVRRALLREQVALVVDRGDGG
jgi:fatty-acyl-CoA synthase